MKHSKQFFKITYLVTGGKRTDWIELYTTWEKLADDFETIRATDPFGYETRYAIEKIEVL